MDVEALLAARPARRENVGAWYAQLLEAAGDEGIAIGDLAERVGCSRETLYAWRRRLRATAAGEDERQTRGLVRVRVADAEREAEANRLEVRTRAGHTVLVPARFDASALASVVAVLERC